MTTLPAGCKLVMVYSRGFSCCAPRDAQLGVFVATYTIEPTAGKSAEGNNQARRGGNGDVRAASGTAKEDEEEEEEEEGEGEDGGDDAEENSADPEDWDIDPLSGRRRVKPEEVEKDVGWDGVSV